MKISTPRSSVKLLEAIPQDIYTLSCTKAEVKESSTKNPMIKAEFVVTEGEFHGRKLFDNFSLQDQALFKVAQYCEMAGISWGEDGFESNDMVGTTVKASVTQELYEEKVTNKIKDYMKA